MFSSEAHDAPDSVTKFIPPRVALWFVWGALCDVWHMNTAADTAQNNCILNQKKLLGWFMKTMDTVSNVSALKYATTASLYVPVHHSYLFKRNMRLF
jgi:hypothetical protein